MRIDLAVLGNLLLDDVVDADVLSPFGDMAVGPDGAAWIAAGGPDALIRVGTDGSTRYALPDLPGVETPWAWSVARPVAVPVTTTPSARKSSAARAVSARSRGERW